jgi:hypothetical protein
MLPCGHPREIGNRGNWKRENYKPHGDQAENFRTLRLDLHTPSAAKMDTGSLLLASVRKVLDEVVKGPIVDEGKICVAKFRKHR